MAEKLSSDVEIVSKLKRRLHDAAYQQKQAMAVLKVLNRLSMIHMSLEILKVTHVGKEVNSLRKWDGEVGEKAKALVRKWKQLLPDSESASTSHSSGSTTTNAGSCSSSSINATPTIINGIGESTTSHSHSQGQASHRKKKGGRLEEEGSRGVHVTYTPHKSSGRPTGGLAMSSDHDDFSKALMMDTTTNAAAITAASSSSSSVRRTKEHIADSSGSVDRGHSTEGTHRHKHKHKHKHSHKESPSKAASASGALPAGHHSKPPSMPAPSTPKKPAMGVTPTISSLTRPKSPPIGSFLDTLPMPGGSGATYSPRSEADSSPAVAVNSRKRKANLESSVGAVALTKRSRTQVYSGKRSLTGPQVVPSLFDQAMRVLMDNIDDIGEVGGVPYFILEPVLQKCTPTQLMRLEEYNEQFLEDTDPLWEKHCQKEFKGCRPTSGQSWRELYIERLAQREERLKSLTATIKAKEQARQEPVRKAAIIADVSRMPARRRRAGGFRSRRLEEEQSASTSKLGSLRKKMAKQMQMMRVYKPGRR